MNRRAFPSSAFGNGRSLGAFARTDSPPRRPAAMKYAAERSYSDPEKAARRLMEHAHVFEPVQDGRIYIEKINGPFLFGDKGTPAEYSAASSSP